MANTKLKMHVLEKSKEIRTVRKITARSNSSSHTSSPRNWNGFHITQSSSPLKCWCWESVHEAMQLCFRRWGKTHQILP